MKSPYQFIVRPIGGTRYNNTKKYGDVDFITNSSVEAFQFSNRQAEVIETPIKYDGPIKPGDTLLVHHNVFKFYYDSYGQRKSGKSFFKEDIFLLDPDQFFAYGRDGEWFGYDRYCFVKPVPKEESYVYKPFSNEPLMGEMVIVNESLKKEGVKKGDKVCYRPKQEYEFRVDGELLYRMYDHSISMIL